HEAGTAAHDPYAGRPPPWSLVNGGPLPSAIGCNGPVRGQVWRFVSRLPIWQLFAKYLRHKRLWRQRAKWISGLEPGGEKKRILRTRAQRRGGRQRPCMSGPEAL